MGEETQGGESEVQMHALQPRKSTVVLNLIRRTSTSDPEKYLIVIRTFLKEKVTAAYISRIQKCKGTQTSGALDYKAKLD